MIIGIENLKVIHCDIVNDSHKNDKCHGTMAAPKQNCKISKEIYLSSRAKKNQFYLEIVA